MTGRCGIFLFRHCDEHIKKQRSMGRTGIYLNGTSAYGLFQEECSLMYFVDKKEMIRELVPLVELKHGNSGKFAAEGGKSPKYVCITRPCRFGKTVMANMIVS